MDDFRLLGQQFGLEYAEAFRYIGPEPSYVGNILNTLTSMPYRSEDGK